MELLCANYYPENGELPVIFYESCIKTQIIIDCLLESARNNGVKVQVKDTTNELYKK